ncbi:DUF296 domain-containing protein [Paracoccus sp. 11-3]|uniref:DUF296 domain-containing protein n=2 Tax=Paracoccus amoyensis TaxID=2760093 RepID=A0A926J9Y5_9RHOB|nr:DUF296 domain-containing protein [Paracoccus amoyensis]MBC9245486.1 DUF296 domain-containing protein [Paracoccus amoyensis]
MIHPGPRADQRVQARRATLVPIKGILPAGVSVMQAVGDLFAAHGCRGGMLWLDGVTCDPMRYVLPALSTDGLHAAWYSETYAPDGPWVIESATASVGQKNGEPFLHCHGIWTNDRTRDMGHLLPFDSILTAQAQVSGLGAADTWFESLPDSETAFTLFTPVNGDRGRSVLARLLPGEDVITAIEALAAEHGILHANLHAVGSIDHIRFTDGRRVDCLATELHFTGATLADGSADIPIEVVDITGEIHRGTLTRGHNPVGVTVELIIETKGQKA